MENETSPNTNLTIPVTVEQLEDIDKKAASQGRTREQFLESVVKSAARQKNVNNTVPIENHEEIILNEWHEKVRKHVAQIKIMSGTVQELINSSDRSTGIVGGTFVDDALTYLIKSYWKFIRRDNYDESFEKSVFDFQGVLGTFGSRLQIAKIAGLITEKTYNEIFAIKQIRNKCAHLMTSDPDIGYVPISFDTTPIIELVNIFDCSKCIEMRNGPNDGDRVLASTSTNKGKFILKTFTLGSDIYNQGNFLRNAKGLEHALLPLI